MAIAFVGSTLWDSAHSSVVNGNVDVPNLTNGILIVSSADNEFGGQTALDGLTSDQDGAFTQLNSNINQDSSNATLWYILNPTAGIHVITPSYGDSVLNRPTSLIAHWWSGVHQTTPFGTPNSATGTGTAVSVTVASVVEGDVVIDSLCINAGGEPTYGADQTKIEWNPASSGSGTIRGAASQQAGVDGGVMSYTLGASNHWAILAAALKPSAAAASDPIDTLVDGFDTEIDADVWGTFTEEDSSVTWISGRVELTAEVTTTSAYAELKTDAMYDLDESSVFAEISDVVVPDNGFIVLDLVAADDSSIEIVNSHDGTISAALDDVPAAELNQFFFSTTYNATTHRWFRIRESSGTVFIDASENGVNWTNLGSVTPTTDAGTLFASVPLKFWIFADNAVADRAEAWVDNVNVEGQITASESEGLSLGDSSSGNIGGEHEAASSDGLSMGEDITTGLADDSGPDGIELGDDAEISHTDYTTPISDALTLGDNPDYSESPQVQASDRIALGEARTHVQIEDSFTDSSFSNHSPIDDNLLLAQGQSWRASASPLPIYAVRFALKREGAPTGTAKAEIYAHAGTFGEDSIPSGSPLATSVTSVDVFDLPLDAGGYVMQPFYFDGSWTPSANQTYVVVLRPQEDFVGDGDNAINMHHENGGDHEGNRTFQLGSTGEWAASSTSDIVFSVESADPLGSDLEAGPDFADRPTDSIVMGDTSLSILTDENRQLSDSLSLGDAITIAIAYIQIPASDTLRLADFASHPSAFGGGTRGSIRARTGSWRLWRAP